MRCWEPKFIEDSKFPVWVSKFAPIEIWAINIGPFVWCRGKMDPRDKLHETIHYQQQLELLFVFHWLLYFLFWIVGVIRYRNGISAYLENPFEIEAYQNEHNLDYLLVRKRYAWLKNVV